MRVYELAKKHNLSSKELIEILKTGGFSVVSHMSVLSEAEMSYCNTELSNQRKREGVSNKKIEKSDTKVSDSVYAHQDQSSVVEKTVSNGKFNPVLQDAEELRLSKKDTDFTKKGHAINKNEQISSPSLSKKEAPVSEELTHKDKKKSPYFTVNSMTVSEFAEKANIPLSNVVLQLPRTGVLATKNQSLSEKTVAKLAKHYELPITKEQSNTVTSGTVGQKFSSDKSYTEVRSPIVVVIGHVDHGKTTLLDFIRKTRVAAKEKGGITQHIGAHEVETSHGKIVFIDTPGHEAFVKIRQRGIRVADIAILVVAADDGVMPQTIEAIRQAKSMNLTIIVAINKIDRVAPDRIEIVKRQLTQYEIVVEDWGGDVICVPISAKQGTGITQLLDMISLQAELLELKTSLTQPAKGYILETKLERGRGVVATIICPIGVLRVNDYFMAGNTTGRVTSMMNSTGKNVVSALPAVPVQISGFDNAPEVGDIFSVVSKELYSKTKQDAVLVTKQNPLSLASSQEDGINIILKTDNESSKEAVLDFIASLNKKYKKQLVVIVVGIGTANESDVELAYNAAAHIVLLHAKTENKAISLAQARKISIHSFDIIYKLTEFLESWIIAESSETVEVRKKIGQAEVLKVFDIKGVGVIAGSILRDGRFVKDGFVVAIRKGKKIGEGKISGLQRDRKTVKEVHTGFEFGFFVDGFTDWLPDDVAECYVLQKEIIPAKH
ncbi:translation initiation factor IF-2 [bacterium]|nr:MAG: translation initiation factor IF-2 [bacterium]